MLSFGRALFNNELRDELMERALTRDVVLLDDFGAEFRKRDGSGYLETLLEEVVWSREAQRKPTLITTNLTPGEFAELLGDRIGDRLLGDWGMIAALPGKSLRRGAS